MSYVDFVLIAHLLADRLAIDGRHRDEALERRRGLLVFRCILPADPTVRASTGRMSTITYVSQITSV